MEATACWLALSLAWLSFLTQFITTCVWLLLPIGGWALLHLTVPTDMFTGKPDVKSSAVRASLLVCLRWWIMCVGLILGSVHAQHASYDLYLVWKDTNTQQSRYSISSLYHPWIQDLYFSITKCFYFSFLYFTALGIELLDKHATIVL